MSEADEERAREALAILHTGARPWNRAGQRALRPNAIPRGEGWPRT